VEDMTDEGVARVRKLLGRMLDYVSDHRPSAREVALELEDLRRFVMPQRRIDLIDFADDAVRSLMDAQPPVPFEDAVDDLEDREFFTASEPPPRSRHQSTSWRSRALVAGSAVVFFAVGAVAVARLAADAGSTPVVPEASGLAVVKVWFPPDATARIGEYRIEPGQHIEIPVGPAVLDIRCEDGSTHQCAFHAIDGSAVRLFELRGQRGITVNDGDFLPCEP